MDNGILICLFYLTNGWAIKIVPVGCWYWGPLAASSDPFIWTHPILQLRIRGCPMSYLHLRWLLRLRLHPLQGTFSIWDFPITLSPDFHCIKCDCWMGADSLSSMSRPLLLGWRHNQTLAALLAAAPCRTLQTPQLVQFTQFARLSRVILQMWSLCAPDMVPLHQQASNSTVNINIYSSLMVYISTIIYFVPIAVDISTHGSDTLYWLW